MSRPVEAERGRWGSRQLRGGGRVMGRVPRPPFARALASGGPAAGSCGLVWRSFFFPSGSKCGPRGLYPSTRHRYWETQHNLRGLFKKKGSTRRKKGLAHNRADRGGWFSLALSSLSSYPSNSRVLFTAPGALVQRLSSCQDRSPRLPRARDRQQRDSISRPSLSPRSVAPDRSAGATMRGCPPASHG
jgi:hypothetical protein